MLRLFNELQKSSELVLSPLPLFFSRRHLSSELGSRLKTDHEASKVTQSDKTQKMLRLRSRK